MGESFLFEGLRSSSGAGGVTDSGSEVLVSDFVESAFGSDVSIFLSVCCGAELAEELGEELELSTGTPGPRLMTSPITGIQELRPWLIGTA